MKNRMFEKISKAENYLKMSDKIVVYTAITNQYDSLSDTEADSEVSYVVFTESEIRQTFWEKRKICDVYRDTRRNARRHKILSHEYFPDASITLWIDGSFDLKVPVKHLVEKYLANSDIAVFPHPWRNCIYEEFDACCQWKLDHYWTMKKQVNRYRQEGYPSNNGLVATGIILRRNTEQMKKLNDMWWHEIEYGSVRDQLSFNYCLWKLGIEYTEIKGNILSSEYVHRRPHNRLISGTVAAKIKKYYNYYVSPLY